MVPALLAGCGNQSAGPGDFDAYRDEVLDRYFTEDAARILRNVPLNEGNVNFAAGFSVGPDWGSRLAAAVFGYGWDRQVLIMETVGEFVVFHEYVHQADYFGMIDRGLFASRYAQLQADVGYRAIAEDTEAWIIELHSGDFLSQLALAYNDGLTRELIAYLIEGYVRGDYELPEYFLEVYRDVVRIRAFDDSETN